MKKVRSVLLAVLCILLLSSIVMAEPEYFDSDFWKHRTLEQVKQVISPSNVNVRNSNEITPLFLAVKYAKPELVKYLINIGAEVNASTGEKNNNECPIHRIRRNPYAPEVIKILYQAGADMNALTNSSFNVMHYVVYTPAGKSGWENQWNNLPKTLQALIDCGVNVNTVDFEGLTPLLRLSDRFDTKRRGVVKDPEIFRILLKGGANPNARVVRTKNNDKNDFFQERPNCLSLLARANPSPEVFEALIEGGADPNATSKTGRSALHYAGRYRNNPEVVHALVKGGGNINLATETSITPLHEVYFWKAGDPDYKTVEAFVKHGANVNAQSDKGITPFHCACARDDVAIVKLMINHGADVNLPEKDGDTPLYLAAERSRCAEIITCLLQAGANPLPPSCRRPIDAIRKNKNLRNTPAYYALQKATEQNAIFLPEEKPILFGGVNDQIGVSVDSVTVREYRGLRFSENFSKYEGTLYIQNLNVSQLNKKKVKDYKLKLDEYGCFYIPEADATRNYDIVNIKFRYKNKTYSLGRNDFETRFLVYPNNEKMFFVGVINLAKENNRIILKHVPIPREAPHSSNKYFQGKYSQYRKQYDLIWCKNDTTWLNQGNTVNTSHLYIDD